MITLRLIGSQSPIPALGGPFSFRQASSQAAASTSGPASTCHPSCLSMALTTQREKLIKIGAKVVRHAKCVAFQVTDGAVPRELFAPVLERIQWFWRAATAGRGRMTATPEAEPER